MDEDKEAPSAAGVAPAFNQRGKAEPDTVLPILTTSTGERPMMEGTLRHVPEFVPINADRFGEKFGDYVG